MARCTQRTSEKILECKRFPMIGFNVITCICCRFHHLFPCGGDVYGKCDVPDFPETVPGYLRQIHGKESEITNHCKTYFGKLSIFETLWIIYQTVILQYLNYHFLLLVFWIASVVGRSLPIKPLEDFLLLPACPIKKVTLRVGSICLTWRSEISEVAARDQVSPEKADPGRYHSPRLSRLSTKPSLQVIFHTWYNYRS